MPAQTLRLFMLAYFILAFGSSAASAQDGISCKNAVKHSAVVRITWYMDGSLLPCETHVPSDGLVVVRVKGANPAIASYSLSTTHVRVTTVPSAGQDVEKDAEAPPPTKPSAPADAKEAAETKAPDKVNKASQNAADTLKVTFSKKSLLEKNQQRGLIALGSAREVLKDAIEFINGLQPAYFGDVCHDAGLPVAKNYWQFNASAAALHSAMKRNLYKVMPPVSEENFAAASACVASVAASPWESIILNGPSDAARFHAQATADVKQWVESVEDQISKLESVDVPPFEDVEAEQSRLLQGLKAIRTTLKGSLDQELSKSALDRTLATVKETTGWADLIRRSKSEVVLETIITGDRGQSQHVELRWEPLVDGVDVSKGSQTILIDRFSGVLLNVSGSAGFAGIKRHEILKRAALATNGTLVKDSVDLIANSYRSWSPALSTGLSATYHWRDGFFLGVGIDILVLADADGDATTRIGIPIFHFGRDNTRLFAGLVQGAASQSILSKEQYLRRASADPIPDNLIVKNKGLGVADRFYLGVVFGKSSIGLPKSGEQKTDKP